MLQLESVSSGPAQVNTSAFIGSIRVCEADLEIDRLVSFADFTRVMFHGHNATGAIGKFYAKELPVVFLHGSHSSATILEGQFFLHAISNGCHIFAEVQPATHEGQLNALALLRNRVNADRNEIISNGFRPIRKCSP